MADSSNAPIPETMEGLRRQNSAYRSLCASLEAIQATQTDLARRCHEAETTLDSEREANALLTERVEHLEREARRFAGMYSQGTDGRNTFVIFADKIAAQSEVDPLSLPLNGGAA